MKRVALTSSHGLIVGWDSTVPGLAVAKPHKKGPWYLYHAPSGLRLSAESYRTRAAALQAAERISTCADWTASAAIFKGNWKLAIAIRSALRDPEAVAREQRHEEAQRRIYDPYITAGEVETATGHTFDWMRSGQRSLRGHCRACGYTGRISYQAVSRTYKRTGAAATTCEPSLVPEGGEKTAT